MTIEMPANFGYVDSVAYLDGEPGDAATRREAIRNGNRLVSRAQDPIDYHMIPCSDATADQEVEGVCRGYGSLGWQLIRGPRMGPKKPGLTRAECRVMMRFFVPFTGAPGGQRFWLQICTSAAPFNPDGLLASGANILQMQPTAGSTVEQFNKFDIPVQYGQGEKLAYYIRGGMTDVAMSVTFGTQTGTVAAPPAGQFDDGRVLYGTGTGWGTTIATAGHYVSFSGLNTVHQIAHRQSATELHITPSAHVVLAGRTFSIYQLGRWNLAAINLYPQDREI